MTLKGAFLKSRERTPEGAVRHKTGDKLYMSAREEKMFDKAVDKEFKGHRLPESGKNFLYHRMAAITPQEKENYSNGYDGIVKACGCPLGQRCDHGDGE